MNKGLKEAIRTAEELQRKGILYLDDSIDIGEKLNYQVIATIVGYLSIFMDEEKYEVLKNDKKKLLYKLALSSFGESDLIYNFSTDFKITIINEFINLDDPELIEGTCFFSTNYGKLQELYEKALIQIEEGKFENIIF